MYSKIKRKWLAVKAGWKTVVGVGSTSRGLFFSAFCLSILSQKEALAGAEPENSERVGRDNL